MPLGAMRLLHTRTRLLHEFTEVNVKPYAILSHTWREGEVTFQDIHNEYASKKPGYSKIEGSCKQALLDGWEYLWIDTCCIDKSSSSELQEAINSMFLWYQRAEVCYAFLDDVHVDADLNVADSQFKKCRWFTRGWTLQELIAPDNLNFYDQNWISIGSKKDHWSIISEVTRIPESVLVHRSLQEASIAKRLSWAANRQTERLEDKAYCLLGILNVHMAMVYGEGERAFIRLQEEIIKSSLDHSLFAWTRTGSSKLEGHGVLARSPDDFFGSGNIVPYPFSGTAPYAMTNKGLEICLTLFSTEGACVEDGASFVEYAVLRCHQEESSKDEIAIPLQSLGADQYQRIIGSHKPRTVSELTGYKRHSGSTKIYIRINIARTTTIDRQLYTFLLPKLPSDSFRGNLKSVYPQEFWDKERNSLYAPIKHYLSWLCALTFEYDNELDVEDNKNKFVLFIGLDYGFRNKEPLPWCKILYSFQKTIDLPKVWKDCDKFNDKRHYLEELHAGELLKVTITKGNNRGEHVFIIHIESTQGRIKLSQKSRL